MAPFMAATGDYRSCDYNHDALPERIRDNDWCQVFSFAGHEPREAGIGGGIAPGFDHEDVAEVLYTDEGEREGDSWIGVFKLKDGRFAFVSAGCDYTGWACQAGGSGVVHTDLAFLLRMGLGDDDRSRLGIVLEA